MVLLIMMSFPDLSSDFETNEQMQLVQLSLHSKMVADLKLSCSLSV